MQSGFDINELVQEAQNRWLKPVEVLFILQNHESHQITQEPPQKPLGGSLFLFNKRVLRFFRRDGHSWRKKKDGRTVGEAHERLKVGNVEALNCYYAHGEENPNFQRRSYWMLDPAYEHIVLVHYRDVIEGKQSSQLSPISSTFSQSQSSYTAQNLGSNSVISELQQSYQNQYSPTEVSSEVVIKTNGMIHLKNTNISEEFNNRSSGIEVSQALRRLEEQLSLNEDNLEEIGIFGSQNENFGNSGGLNDGNIFSRDQQVGSVSHDQLYGGYAGMQDYSNSLGLLENSGADAENHHQSLGTEDTAGSNESLSWNQMVQFYEQSSSEIARLSASDELPSTLENPLVLPVSLFLPQDVENIKFSADSSSVVITEGAKPDYYAMLFNQSQTSSLTISQKQKFTIREISPEWGYTNEATKVIIVGSFLCDTSECEWKCMFGDVEVPTHIIQEGVISCHSPPHPTGNVTLCITSGNRESCSEVRDFEYRDKITTCSCCDLPGKESTKITSEEQLLLVRFVQLLISESLSNGEEGSFNSVVFDMSRKLKADEDSWGQVIEDLLVGSVIPSSITDWLLQEVLKDKLIKWLSSKRSLSRKEQGIIHMVAGLGFEWALNPILNAGVSVNFRDINGWTALHWAASFGREKMVAALVASGASAGALTDPTSQDPTGKSPASIAAINGHKGLAGYLSEVALTSHLSSLTLEETELSKNNADVEAEMTVNSISKVNNNLSVSEDHMLLKDTLAAVRNAAQAAARIQSAFRAHSFRRRQHRDASDSVGVDEYGFALNEVQGILAASKLAFSSKLRDHNNAALSIQKKYRGWKGRKDFLALRQKVVKIQAHVRGHQVRKQYKVICWAVGVLEKVVLRWRRKGVGLRGYRPEAEPIGEESEEDEDILKVFRRQKVEVAIDEAVSRVLSMVESQDARQQYHRMLQKYRQAKAKLNATRSEAASTSSSDVSNMVNDDMFQFP